MKLTNRQAIDLYAALAKIGPDNKDVKLSPDVWIKIAINKNKLQSKIADFEALRMRVFADAVKPAEGEKVSQAELEARGTEAMTNLHKTTMTTGKLQTVVKKDLRLDDNPAICGLLAELMPIVDDIDQGNDVGEE